MTHLKNIFVKKAAVWSYRLVSDFFKTSLIDSTSVGRINRGKASPQNPILRKENNFLS